MSRILPHDMKHWKTLSVAIVLALLSAVAPAAAQSAVTEACKLPNTTVIYVTMANGSVVQFLLERKGSSMQGVAVFDRGKGPVKGEFSGQHMYWDVSWEDGSQASFRGQLLRGEGSGTASHSSNKNATINWTARTPDGCTRWPDTQSVTPGPDTTSGAPAQLFAPPQASAPAQTPAPVKAAAPAKASPPAAQVPRVQTKAASAPAPRASRQCPAGTIRIDNGDCVKQVESARPSLLPLPIPGLGGLGIVIGR